MVAKTEAVLLSCRLSVSHTQPQTEWLLFKEQSFTCLFKKKTSERWEGREMNEWRKGPEEKNEGRNLSMDRWARQKQKDEEEGDDVIF